jgi:H/ACA ribonucleoprotein complex subunit 4
MAKVEKAEEVDYAIKPENVTSVIPTSEWPLLLKNYDKRQYPEKTAV